MPSKLRDKNGIIQTKQVMHELDQNIREVVREGPGSQRVLTVNIKTGFIRIDNKDSLIIWQYNNSKVIISDIGIPVFEGKLTILTENANVKNNYNIQIYTNYTNLANITRSATKPSTLVGITDMVIRNDGLDQNNVVKVSISETNK